MNSDDSNSKRVASVAVVPPKLSDSEENEMERRIRLLRQPRTPRDHERAEDIARRLENDRRNEHIADFLEATKPKKTDEDVMTLWLAVHIHQGGRFTVGRSESFETPSEDAAMNFPTGFGATSTNALVLKELTPSVTLEPSQTDKRKGWEFGHSEVRRLGVDNGVIFANVNEDEPVVTQEQLSAARKITRGKLAIVANELYDSLDLDTEIVRPRSSQDLPIDEYDHISAIEESRRWEIQHDEKRRGLGKESREGGKPSRLDKSWHTSQTIRKSNIDRDDDSISRAIRDPLGIADPGGVKDPLASFIRGQTFGDSNGFGI